jgi:hypothetical protein
MNKTLVLWWRYGKEHDPAGNDYRVNPLGVVARHLDEKAAAFRSCPGDQWRWWQVDDDLLIERADPHGHNYGPDTRIYYLPRRGLGVIENLHHAALNNDRWRWFMHVADTYWDAGRECWVMQDMFADILVDASGRACRVTDLDDLATALDLGLLTPPQASTVLRTTQATVDAIQQGQFPFPEIERARAACRELGWDRAGKT